ncbi:MAG: DUF362 domain-containing protein [Deltaproteobacteria bacterium]|nr:DUF362 domain-containing protein [Deltaproteobacteria bacterium]
MKPKAAITKCSGYEAGEVYAAVSEAVNLLGGIRAFAGPGERILIKPNLLASRTADKAVTTHPAVVAALIRLVADSGARPFVGDSPAIGSAKKVAEKSGILDACRDAGAELIELKELVVVENPGGHRFKRLEVSKEALSFDGIINAPKLKTHAQMHLTLGVKNLFGCVPGRLKPQWHLSAGVDSADFADMLLDLCFYLKPRLTVMDGIVAMEGNGPSSGTPRPLGLVFASHDAVAMDAVAANVLGAKRDDLPILKAATRRGMAGAEIGAVDVLGCPVESVKVHGFKFPPFMSVNFAAGLPYFIDKRLRSALTSRPAINNNGCTLCSVCVNVCPPGVMTRSSRIEIDYDRCIRCYCCQEVCPEGAIAPVEGWIKRLIPGL